MKTHVNGLCLVILLRWSAFELSRMVTTIVTTRGKINPVILKETWELQGNDGPSITKYW